MSSKSDTALCRSMHADTEAALVIAAYTLFRGLDLKYPTVAYLTAHRAFPQCTSASRLWWLCTAGECDAAGALDLPLRAYAQAVLDTPTLSAFRIAMATAAQRYGAVRHAASLRALARCIVAWDPWDPY